MNKSIYMVVPYQQGLVRGSKTLVKNMVYKYTSKEVKL